jgi:hypothetical protein
MFQVLFIFAGTICTVLGALLWLKKRSDLFKPYHLKGVRDVERYCVYMGRTIFAFGAAVIVIAFLSLLSILNDVIWSFVLMGVTVWTLYFLALGRKKC